MNLKKRDLEKKLHIKSINKHDIEKIDFSSHKKDWEKFALNILFVSYNSKI